MFVWFDPTSLKLRRAGGRLPLSLPKCHHERRKEFSLRDYSNPVRPEPVEGNELIKIKVGQEKRKKHLLLMIGKLLKNCPMNRRLLKEKCSYPSTSSGRTGAESTEASGRTGYYKCLFSLLLNHINHSNPLRIPPPLKFLRKPLINHLNSIITRNKIRWKN
jgi:hypothetical protein